MRSAGVSETMLDLSVSDARERAGNRRKPTEGTRRRGSTIGARRRVCTAPQGHLVNARGGAYALAMHAVSTPHPQ